MLSRVQFIASGPWTCTFRNVPSFSNRLSCTKETAIFFKQCLSLGVHDTFRWKSSNTNQNSSVPEVKENENTELTIGGKVKQTAKDASYLGIIIAGIGVTGIMFYAILRELFSGQSPNSIYTEALKICRNDIQVADTLGEPIKGYGELSSRGRRRHVSHLKYEKDGKNYMRMKFYVEGSRRKGTVHLEVIEGKKGSYEYRYLFVDLDGFPTKTIILKDNRHLYGSNETVE
ncbi:Mitochondrial import inner membrane translocase subunit Tim21, partial [Stegodyphus mimosarum]